MRISFQKKNIELPKAQEALIEEKLRFTFKRFDHHIAAVGVYLADVNGPKGGRDKACRLEIRLTAGSDVVITGTYDTIFEAIDKSCSRGKQALTNQIKKSASVRRKQRGTRKEAGLAG